MESIISIVEKLDRAGIVRANKIMGEYYSIYCPIHGGGQERRPSCGILLNTQVKNGQLYKAGWVHCFSCGYAKDLPQMITEVFKSRNMSETGEEWLTKNVEGYDFNLEDSADLVDPSILEGLTAQYAVNQIAAMTQPKVSYVSEEELAQYRYTCDYMYQRKLTDEVIAKYDVGLDLNFKAPGRKNITPSITFPVRDIQGNTLFIYRRAIEAKFFNMPDNLTKPVYGIYELPKDVKSVIICESIINALTCASWGYHAVALFGTGNPYQMEQLRRLGVQEFIICLDGDFAGQRATKKIKRQLGSNAIIWSIKMPEEKDINDCTKEEFNTLYEEKE